MTELLHENFKERTGLIIEIKNKKFVNRLKRYGDLYYVSKRMNYAVIYVNQTEVTDVIEQIKNENFVNNVSVSPKGSMALEYDGLLDQMQKEIDLKKKEKEAKNADDLMMKF